MIEGAALFYKGFKVVNSLNTKYLLPLIKLANLNDLFERSPSSADEVIIEYFYVTPNGADIVALSPDISLEADDEYVKSVIESGNFMKDEDEEKKEESKNSTT